MLSLTTIQFIPHFLLFCPFPRFIPHNSPPSQHAKKVMSNSPGLVNFAIALVNSPVIALLDGQVIFLEEFKLQKNSEINLNIKTFFGLVEMMFGLVNVSFSLLSLHPAPSTLVVTYLKYGLVIHYQTLSGQKLHPTFGLLTLYQV